MKRESLRKSRIAVVRGVFRLGLIAVISVAALQMALESIDVFPLSVMTRYAASAKRLKAWFLSCLFEAPRYIAREPRLNVGSASELH